jgi:cytochrome c oxidase cbb3-type subunit 2
MKRENRASIIGTVLSVAGVYAYFLLFAQFAFLERIKAGVGEGATLKAVLGLMALGGIGSGFVAARVGSPRRGLAYALILCAVVAGVAALPLPGWMFPVLSFATGAAMGTATVCLAGRLAGAEARNVARGTTLAERGGAFGRRGGGGVLVGPGRSQGAMGDGVGFARACRVVGEFSRAS